MTANYVICATPRSGSNFLCEMLSSLGFAGRPEEHLWVPNDVVPQPLATSWPRILAAGRGDNGAFGIKLMYYQARRLEEELPDVLGMDGCPLGDVLDGTLTSPRYIYLTRRDHLRQAISLVKASQSGQWRSMDESARSPVYDAEAIAEAMSFLARDELDWEAFFVRNTLSPYRLTYEELDTNLTEALESLLGFLGSSNPTVPVIPVPRHHRQADEATEQWVRQYRTDSPRQEPGRRAKRQGLIVETEPCVLAHVREPSLPKISSCVDGASHATSPRDCSQVGAGTVVVTDMVSSRDD